MTTTQQPERRKCPRWCDWSETPDHPGPHQAVIGDIVIPHGPVIAVTGEADGRRPFCVLTVAHQGEHGYTRAVMSWEMAARLAGHLMRGHQSYAS